MGEVTQNTNGDDLDCSELYALHHSDHPGLVLVTKVLDGDNYSTWSRSMKISLSAKNKLGFIDGSILTPDPLDTDYASWRRCNDMVLSWLLNSLTPDLANSVIYADTPAEIWHDLKKRFSRGNITRMFEIQRDIVENKQEQQSISLYYTKLKSLWDELNSYNILPPCSCGVMKYLNERFERGRLIEFLMGLNETYSAIRGQIMLMQPLPSVKRAYSLLMEEEKQRQVVVHRESATESHAMNISRSKERPHTQSTRKSLYCTHCDGTTHTIDRCFFINGFPPGHKFHGKNVKPPIHTTSKRPSAYHAQIDSSKGSNGPPTQGENLKFTQDEYNQIKALLRNGNTQSYANVAGLENEEDNWLGEAP